jgi:hypothetical protein
MVAPLQPGVYNQEYFSGAQVSLYIGDVWVDEVTSISYQVSQQRVPLYGYADQLWRDVAEGQVLVQGNFSINFKEAGYLWVILKRYNEIVKNNGNILIPFSNKNQTLRRNIERIVNGEVGTFDRNRALTEAAASLASDRETAASLGMPVDNTNLPTTSDTIFDVFEEMVWGVDVGGDSSITDHRRADDVRLNPFDIYMTYGDFTTDDETIHNTIRRINDVYIIGTSQQVVIDGQPIQEVYSFIARNIV